MAKTSTRFVFLGDEIGTVQDGPDKWRDFVPMLSAAEGHHKVHITLPGHQNSYPTSMDWPSSDADKLVEIAPAVVEAVDQADREGRDVLLQELRRRAEEHIQFLPDQPDPE